MYCKANDKLCDPKDCLLKGLFKDKDGKCELIKKGDVKDEK